MIASAIFAYMITSDSEKKAFSAIKQLQIRAALNKVPKTAIGEAVKLNRNTVAKSFDSGDMLLSTFIAIAEFLQLSPSEVLAQAEQAEEHKESSHEV